MTTTQRKPARETHGIARFVSTGPLPLPQALDAGETLLALYPERGNATSYQVQRLSDPDGATVGFRLLKLTPFIIDRKVYDIDVTPGYGWQCDCPDAQFQSRECKHCKALRAALVKEGIEVAVPAKQEPAAESCRLDDL